MIDFQIQINGIWASLDHFGEAPAMTFQLNNLGEFKDRNNDYSQAVRLPRSPLNMRLLGFGSLMEAAEGIPYRKYGCQVYDDGVRVVPLGAAFYITALSNTEIEGQILGPEFTLIDDLSARDCTTEKDDGFWLACDLANIYEGSGELPNGVGLRWLAATLLRNYPGEISEEEARGWEMLDSPTKIYPHLNYQDLVKWILEKEGWAVEFGGAVDLGRNFYIPALQPFEVDTGSEPSDLQKLSADFINQPTAVNQKISGVVEFGGPTITSEVPAGAVQAANPLVIPALYSGKYSFGWGVSFYNFSFEGSGSSKGSAAVTARLTVKDSEGGVVSEDDHILEWPAGQAGELSGKTELDVLAGQTVEFYCFVNYSLRGVSQAGLALLGLSVALVSVLDEDSATEEPQIGHTYDLLASLGFSNRADIITEWCRLLGLTIKVDPVNMKIYFFNLADVAACIEDGTGADWTSKFCPREEHTVGYRLDGYAQENVIKFKADDNTGADNKQAFHIADAYLERSKDLWESKFLSQVNYYISPDYSLLAYGHANYPIYEVEWSDEGGRLEVASASWNSPGAPCLVAFSYYPTTRPTREVTLTQGASSKTLSLVVAYSVSLLGLFINDYTMYPTGAAPYSTLLGVLQNCKTLEAYFDLSGIDLKALDLTKPVWLGQFGHWFYIQKINNFQLGKLTKINLIKIK